MTGASADALDGKLQGQDRTRANASFERRRQWRLIGLALPALVFLLVLFGYPVLRLLMYSIEDGTFQHFEKALTEQLYLQVLYDTLRIALIVTVFSLLLSYPLAYFLATTSPLWVTVGFIMVMLPFWTSILVRTYAWMVILGRNGLINKVLLDLGIVGRPIAMMHNELAVLIGMVHVLMPFMLLPIYSAMRRVDRNLVQAAEGLGAPGYMIFLKIYLPLTLQGIVAGSVLVFVISLGFFITPALLGGGQVMMISVLIEQQVRELLNWPFASALSAVLLVTTLVIYMLVQRFTRSAGDAR